MGTGEHWAAEILSTDRKSESLLSCDYSLAFLQKAACRDERKVLSP